MNLDIFLVEIELEIFWKTENALFGHTIALTPDEVKFRRSISTGSSSMDG